MQVCLFEISLGMYMARRGRYVDTPASLGTKMILCTMPPAPRDGAGHVRIGNHSPSVFTESKAASKVVAPNSRLTYRRPRTTSRISGRGHYRTPRRRFKMHHAIFFNAGPFESQVMFVDARPSRGSTAEGCILCAGTFTMIAIFFQSQSMSTSAQLTPASTLWQTSKARICHRS